MKTWYEYHFVGDNFPQYYHISIATPSYMGPADIGTGGEEVTINSLTEYMKMIRRIHPDSTFKVEKFGSVGWQIKELVE